MGCAVSCVNRTTMALFGRQSNSENDARAKLERKLYIAKESPELDFDLSDCQLRHIPSGTFSICKVYRKLYLYLQCNKLQSLDEGGQLSDLYLLRILNLSVNNFTYLPNDIKYLVNLTELYMQENKLKDLPPGIQYLKCLQILDLSKNALQKLNPFIGELKSLRKLYIKENKDLIELCSELCLASNIVLIELDAEQFVFPPREVLREGTSGIMKYMCHKLNIDYSEPLPWVSDISMVQSPSSGTDPFMKQNTKTWEEQELAIIEQENKIHKASQQQREKFLTEIMQEQIQLDNEITKVQVAREKDRLKLIETIQEDEKEIECLVKNFIQSYNLKPEVIQQQLAYEQAEHDRLLEVIQQNYDNVKKSDVLRAMKTLIDDDYFIKHSKESYVDSLDSVKKNVLTQEWESSEKMEQLLLAKDQSRSVLVQQLLEDQDIQKAIVASLLEHVDTRSWSLNQEINLISSHLARLSVIEQEKKKLHISYNYNELMQQRIHLVTLLDDLFAQKSKRKIQLIETLKEMENESNNTTDFWLKNYQKLMDSAPKNLLTVTKTLDPLLANNLLQEGVIHCLPFLVKFLFSVTSITDISLEMLRDNGVTLSSDRESILRAINCYVEAKSLNNNNVVESSSINPSAPLETVEQQNITGVVNMSDTEATLDSECVICMDSKCEVVFIPCGHMCCCLRCSGQEMELCPMCRNSIEKAIKVIIA